MAMSASVPDLQKVIQDGEKAYHALSKFETARYKVLQHCNLLPTTNLNFSPPNTRPTAKMYTVRITSDCTVCHNRHTETNHKSYLLHFAHLPFKCEHGLKISNLHVQEESERTLPFVNLPSQMQKVAPECISMSSGGITTIDKLARDKVRLQQTFNAADEAFTTLSVSVSNSSVDLTLYPQYGADHLNCLIAAIEFHVEECVTFLDDHRENLIRLSEVSEADEIQISADGQVVVLQQPSDSARNMNDLGLPGLSSTHTSLGTAIPLSRPETPLLDRPNLEQGRSSSDSSGQTLMPNTNLGTGVSVGLSSSLHTTTAVSSARMSSLPQIESPAASVAQSLPSSSAATQSLAASVAQSLPPTSATVSTGTRPRSTGISIAFNQTTPITVPQPEIPIPNTRLRGNGVSSSSGIARGLTQGLGILQDSEQLQAEAVRRCQQDMFSTQSSLLTSEARSLQQNVHEKKDRMTPQIAKAFHHQLSLLDRKLSDLSSLRQCYITNQGSRADMESELCRTEAILKGHAYTQSTIRMAIVNAEVETPQQANPTQTTTAPPPVTNFLQKLSLPNFSEKVAEYPSFRQ